MRKNIKERQKGIKMRHEANGTARRTRFRHKGFSSPQMDLGQDFD